MPFYFGNEEDQIETVKVERYRPMITDYFWHEIGDIVVVNKMWFQQDGVTCDTSRGTIDILRGTFAIFHISVMSTGRRDHAI